MLTDRPLGSLRTSAIGLGCMNLSHAYGAPVSEISASRLLNEALDAGVTMLDTAALYGGGQNEALLGRAVGHRRREFLLASKCVLGLSGKTRVLDGSPDAIAASIDRSLARLGTDIIDLLYLHRLDPGVPIEESVGALVRAKEAGKIATIGLSEISAPIVRRAHAVHPIAAVQSEYSLWVRNPEVAVLETCKELGIGFVAFSPLGRGMFAGAVRLDDFVADDIRRTMPRFRPPHLPANLALADRFERIAAANGLRPAQLALAWVLSRGPHVVAIPGTRSVSHLKENLVAATLTPGNDVIAAITEIFAPGAVSGARYNASAQAQIDTELLPLEPIEVD